jgi:hypothetical protein
MKIYLKEKRRERGPDSTGPGQRLVSDSCEHGKEPFQVSQKGGVGGRLDQLRDSKFSRRPLLHGISFGLPFSNSV